MLVMSMTMIVIMMITLLVSVARGDSSSIDNNDSVGGGHSGDNEIWNCQM